MTSPSAATRSWLDRLTSITHRLRRNGASAISVAVVVSTAASLVGSVVTARGMSPYDRGVYLQVMAALATVWGYSTIGVETPIIGVARGSMDSARASLRNTRLATAIALAVASLIAVAATAAIQGDTWNPITGLLSVAIVISATISLRQTTILRVDERYRVLAVAIVIPTTLPPIFMVGILTFSAITVTSALLCYVVGSLTLNCYLWVSGRKVSRHVPSSARSHEAEEGWAFLIRCGAKDLVSTTPVGLLAPLQLLLVGSLISPSAASLFAVAKTVTSPLALISMITSNLFLPKFAGRVSAARGRLLRLSLVTSMGAAALLTVFTIGVGYFAIPALWGQEYAAAVPLAAVLGIGGVFGIGTGICTTAFRASLAYRETIVFSYAILAANIVVGVLVLPRWGLMTFAVASTVLTGLQFAGTGLLLRRNQTWDAQSPPIDIRSSPVPADPPP